MSEENQLIEQESNQDKNSQQRDSNLNQENQQEDQDIDDGEESVRYDQEEGENEVKSEAQDEEYQMQEQSDRLEYKVESNSHIRDDFLNDDDDEESPQIGKSDQTNQQADQTSDVKGDKLNQKKKSSKSRSRTKSKEKKKQPHIYCCGKCKRNDKGGKTCICVVPASQRRTQIVKNNNGDHGCQSCGCKGCSIEDTQKPPEQQEQVQQKEKQKQKKKQSKSRSNSNDSFRIKNGCCKKCLKAFSMSGKACLCQVPLRVRKTSLPIDGCKFCGCKGCNPEDTRGVSPEKDKKQGKRQNQRSRSYSESSESDQETYRNLNNFDKSALGQMIQANKGQNYPILIGFGVPQRTYSYLMGKPKRK